MNERILILAACAIAPTCRRDSTEVAAEDVAAYKLKVQSWIEANRPRGDCLAFCERSIADCNLWLDVAKTELAIQVTEKAT